MPVTKPNLITSGASMHSVKRARDGASNRSMAQNAALGLDNFARLLQDDPANVKKIMPQGQNSLPRVHQDMLKAAGIGGAEPVNAAQRPALQNMSPAQRAMQASNQPLSMLHGLENTRLAGSDGAVLALKTAANKVKGAAKSAAAVVSGSIGALSGMFESGREGIAAIGYDKVGGTSYGKYQIASNTGTFDAFLKYLDKEAPAYAKELRGAGDANTGSKDGAMPEAWKAIAAREPEKFAAVQHGFIHQNLYSVAAKRLGEHGIDESKLSPVLREVLFSTAVQHGAGGAARIVSRAVSESDKNTLMAPEGMPGMDKGRAEEQVIKRIYSIRQDQFGSSTPYVQKAVSNRLNSELSAALNMLKTGNLG